MNNDQIYDELYGALDTRTAGLKAADAAIASDVSTNTTAISGLDVRVTALENAPAPVGAFHLEDTATKLFEATEGASGSVYESTISDYTGYDYLVIDFGTWSDFNSSKKYDPMILSKSMLANSTGFTIQYHGYSQNFVRFSFTDATTVKTWDRNSAQICRIWGHNVNVVADPAPEPEPEPDANTRKRTSKKAG